MCSDKLPANFFYLSVTLCHCNFYYFVLIQDFLAKFPVTICPHPESQVRFFFILFCSEISDYIFLMLRQFSFLCMLGWTLGLQFFSTWKLQVSVNYFSGSYGRMHLSFARRQRKTSCSSVVLLPILYNKCVSWIILSSPKFSFYAFSCVIYLYSCIRKVLTSSGWKRSKCLPEFTLL